MNAATGIDLENIVYYKDETHYFVMTAKKTSLIEKGVILHVRKAFGCLSDTQYMEFNSRSFKPVSLAHVP